MSESHVPQIACLETICFSDPWQEAGIASELDNPLSCWLVALEGESVAGYIGSQTVIDETDMMNIAVHPDHRRQGVAQQLIVSLIEELKLRGSHSLALEVRASNEPAQIFYKKMGFVQIGKRPRYYSNPREDALILRKEWEL